VAVNQMDRPGVRRASMQVRVAFFALAIRFGTKVYDFPDLYAKTIKFELYFHIIFLYLVVLLWLICRGWRKALGKQKQLENIILSINPDVLMVVDAEDRVILCNSSRGIVRQRQLDGCSRPS